MNYSREAVGRMQLDEYVVKIAAIYSANDRNRTLWDVWCHALHHAAAVGERLRKEAPATRIFDEVADFSLWLFTAVHKLEGVPGEPKEPSETPLETLVRIDSGCSDLLWHRYPNTCPLCYARKIKSGEDREKTERLSGPCECPLNEVDESRNKDEKRAALEELRRFSTRTLSSKPNSIDEWQRMFGRVFHAAISRMSFSDVMLHLMEELGEASDAMVRMYSYREDQFVKGEPRQRRLRLESQIADVFSWLFSLVEFLSMHKQALAEFEEWRLKSGVAGNAAVFLSNIIWARYGSNKLHSLHCPFCGNAVCTCPLIFVPATRSVEEWKALLKP